MKYFKFLLVGLALIGGLFYYLPELSSRPVGQFKTIVFVTIDTLRSDHVGVMGYPRNATPFIDRLGKSGVVFDKAFSAISHTSPSHATMFTGRYPFQHGLTRNHEILSENEITLHTYLSSKGFQAASFPAVGFMNGKVGFPVSPMPLKVKGVKDGWYLSASRVVDNSLAWIDSLPKKDNVFLWLHFYDVHQWQGKGKGKLPDKYRSGMLKPDGPELAEFLISKHGIPPEFFGGQEGMLQAINSYDARLRFVDDELERLFQELSKRGLNEEALWIVTSDHGEGLGNHNYEGHGELLYNEQLQIPLIFHTTANILPTHRVEKLVRTVDFFPSIIELLGDSPAKVSPQMIGLSFASALRAGNWNNFPDVLSFAQRRPKDDRSIRHAWRPGDVFAIMDLERKIIDYSIGADEYYEFANDPFELKNILNSGLPGEQEMRSNLEQTLKNQVPGAVKAEEPKLKPKEVKELESLGYL